MIVKGEPEHLERCKAALLKSRLGQEYFLVEEKAESPLLEGISKSEIFVAVDAGGECLGFTWFIL